jgi:polygalacturonase
MITSDGHGLRRRTLLVSGSLAALVWAAGCARTTAGAQPARSGQADPWLADDWTQADRIVAAIAPPRIPDRRVAIADHGAAQGMPDARSAIQTAIDAAAAAGGGRVIVPSGVWLCDGPLHLRSRTELHVTEGATIRFLGNEEKYLPPVLTRFEGTEMYGYSPLIFATDVEDVAITGSGKIDGQGEKNFLPWRKTQAPIKEILRDMGRDGVPVEQRVFVGERRLRPHFIQFFRCRRILVEDVTLVDSPFWMVHPVYCEDVTVRGITCVSRHINSDGVDPDSTKRVLIENCHFEVGDDGVSIKSGRDQDGWRVGIPSEEIVVRNCSYMGAIGGGVAIGSEMSGGVRNVWVDGFTLPKCGHALYFKANLDRGGLIEDIHIRNIMIGETDAAIIFTNDYHSYRGGNSPARFEKMWISNVTADTANYGLALQGHPQAPVRGLNFGNIRIREVKSPLELVHGEEISFRDIEMNGRAITIADAKPWETGKKH